MMAKKAKPDSAAQKWVNKRMREKDGIPNYFNTQIVTDYAGVVLDELYERMTYQGIGLVISMHEFKQLRKKWTTE